MQSRLQLGVAILAVATALTNASVSYAQDSTPGQALTGEDSTAKDQESDDAGTIDVGTIVVTAQRRDQQVQDVPIAVQAFAGEALEETGFRDLRDVITLVPGASEGRGNAAGIRSYQIRGVSSFYGDSTIGYYLDDAAYVVPNRNYAPVARSFDMDRVEVLRGPQGTLYGLGSMGGTIRFITKDPDLQNFIARGDVGVSSTAENGRTNYYGDVALSAPIIEDRLAIRGIASYEHRGGFAQSPSFPGDWDDDTIQNYRVKLLAKPVDAVTLRLSYTRNDTSDDWGQNYQVTSPARFPASPVPGRNRQVYDMYTGYAGFDLGAVLLESSTGYVDRVDKSSGPIVLGPGPTFRLDVLGESDSFVQEVRLVSQHEGPFEWVVGGIYQDARSLEDIKVIGGPPISAVSVYHSKSWAAFGEASVGLFDGKLRPLVGLRYFNDNRNFTTQNRPPGPVLPPAFVRAETFDSVNPRFNLSFKPNENINIYANVAKGFRSGTFNTAAAVAASAGAVGFEVTPDNLWSYELGGKFTLADSRLYLEIVGYTFDWSDIQLNYTVAGGVQVIRNAGDVQGKGIELSANWRPARGLTFQATANVNETEFVRILNPAAFARTPNIAVGKQVTSVPKSTYSLSGSYRTPIGLGGAELSLNATYSFIGRQGDPGDTLGRYGKSQHLLRGRAGFQWDSVGLFLFGENLLGEKDAIQVSGSGSTRYYPRVIGAELSFEF